jgi:hypothetical protein
LRLNADCRRGSDNGRRWVGDDRLLSGLRVIFLFVVHPTTLLL